MVVRTRKTQNGPTKSSRTGPRRRRAFGFSAKHKRLLVGRDLYSIATRRTAYYYCLKYIRPGKRGFAKRRDARREPRLMEISVRPARRMNARRNSVFFIERFQATGQHLQDPSTRKTAPPINQRSTDKRSEKSSSASHIAVRSPKVAHSRFGRCLYRTSRYF